MGILSLPFCHRWYASPSPLDPPRLGLQRPRIQTLAHGPSHGPSWWRSPLLRHTSGNDPVASPPWSPTRSLLWTTSLDPSSFPQNATKSLRLSVLSVALARSLAHSALLSSNFSSTTKPLHTQKNGPNSFFCLSLFSISTRTAVYWKRNTRYCNAFAPTLKLRSIRALHFSRLRQSLETLMARAKDSKPR